MYHARVCACEENTLYLFEEFRRIRPNIAASACMHQALRCASTELVLAGGGQLAIHATTPHVLFRRPWQSRCGATTPRTCIVRYVGLPSTLRKNSGMRRELGITGVERHTVV